MKLTKDQKAITLIALVITIIVLLILAGVALATLTGNTSIIDNANNAVERYNASANEDENIIKEVENLFAKYMGGSNNTGDDDSPAVGDDDDDDDTPPTPDPTSVAVVLKEGDWVMYDTGVPTVGTNGVIPCRVLYNDASHGIQLITMQAVGTNILLGGTDFDTALASYNSAIETLNTAAETYKNATYAYDARCVVSVPTVGANGMFSSKNSETAGPVEINFIYNDLTSIDAKETDTNYETDLTKMGALGTSNENIQEISAFYWLASRYVDHSNDVNPNGVCSFNLRVVGFYGDLSYNGWCAVRSDGNTYGYEDGYDIRPCFSLKSDIKVITEGGKDGTTEAKAYTLVP